MFNGALSPKLILSALRAGQSPLLLNPSEVETLGSQHTTILLLFSSEENQMMEYMKASKKALSPEMK